MLKIGEFSKLSHLTVKALRFYEKKGLLIPVFIDPWTGYRFYETRQLEKAAKIKACRQLEWEKPAGGQKFLPACTASSFIIS